MINAIGHQTGRTSQMLRYAIEEAKTKDVIVIAANQQQVFSFRVMAERLKGDNTRRPPDRAAWSAPCCLCCATAAAPG